MKLEVWSPTGEYKSARGEELVVTFDRARTARLLVLPALFDEASKLRRFTLGVMRALDERQVDSFLPDLPGCNESLAPLSDQTLAGWRANASQAARVFGATHFLSLRAGVLVAPDGLPGFAYAALDGDRVLNSMLRAELVRGREIGVNETREALRQRGQTLGLALCGWALGPRLFSELEAALLDPLAQYTPIDQSDIGANPLWLRAEPDDDPQAAQSLADLIAEAVTSHQEEAQ